MNEEGGNMMNEIFIQKDSEKFKSFKQFKKVLDDLIKLYINIIDSKFGIKFNIPKSIHFTEQFVYTLMDFVMFDEINKNEIKNLIFEWVVENLEKSLNLDFTKVFLNNGKFEKLDEQTEIDDSFYDELFNIFVVPNHDFSVSFSVFSVSSIKKLIVDNSDLIKKMYIQLKNDFYDYIFVLKNKFTNKLFIVDDNMVIIVCNDIFDMDNLEISVIVDTDTDTNDIKRNINLDTILKIIYR
jgi:hypothetical protein